MAASLSEVFIAKLRVGFIEGIATAEREFLDLVERAAENDS